MDKNVGSVDLEELKRAREALNEERGIENDPNMYAGYNPDRNKEESVQEPSAYEENAGSSISVDDVLSVGPNQTESENSEEGDVDFMSAIDGLMNFSAEDSANESQNTAEDEEFNINLGGEPEVQTSAPSLSESVETTSNVVSQTDNFSSAPINFDVYDKFADFEIKNEFAGRSSSAAPAESYVETSGTENDAFISTEAQNIERNEIDSSADLLFETEEIDNDEEETAQITTNEAGEQVLSLQVEVEEDDAEETEEIVSVETPKETNTGIAVISIDSDFDDALKQGKLGELLAGDEDSSYAETSYNTDTHKIISAEEEHDADAPLSSDRKTEILNAISEIRPVSAEKPDVGEEPEETPNDDDIYKVDVIPLNTIEEYDFLEVIGSRVFKSGNQLSYLIGKDEEGELVFENLKTMHNIAIFGSNDKQISSHVSSMILSLMIKNSSEDFKFAICDPSLRSGYDVFEGSSYMWFDSVKKSEDDVFDMLDKIVGELEERYQNFAKINVKSISEFNEAVEPEYQMPHILFVFGNYSNIYHYSNADEINASLYAILKLGRLVGIHTIVTSSDVIENSNINFNLPTRVVFKLDSNEDAESMLGESGAERLAAVDELLHFAVSEEEPIHLKSAKLKVSEIRLILQNIEN